MNSGVVEIVLGVIFGGFLLNAIIGLGLAGMMAFVLREEDRSQAPKKVVQEEVSLAGTRIAVVQA